MSVCVCVCVSTNSPPHARLAPRQAYQRLSNAKEAASKSRDSGLLRKVLSELQEAATRDTNLFATPESRALHAAAVAAADQLDAEAALYVRGSSRTVCVCVCVL